MMAHTVPADERSVPRLPHRPARAAGLFEEQLRTPIGVLVIVTDEADRVRLVDWTDGGPRVRDLLRRHTGWDGTGETGTALPEPATPSAARRALAAYFAGHHRAIEGLATATHGTVFQQTVWRALLDIPAGKTTSYGRLAATIGRPRAVRAVGLANGSNPISIIVPCHRVIGTTGTLTGYGGGLPRKQWLLEFEGARTMRARQAVRAAAGSSA